MTKSIGLIEAAIDKQQGSLHINNALLLKTHPAYIQNLFELLSIISQIKNGLAISLKGHDCVVINGRFTDKDVDHILQYLSEKLPDDIDLHVQRQTEEADLALPCPAKIGKNVQIIPENLTFQLQQANFPENRHLYLKLKTGDSFGQGNHPTTKGCIQAIEWLFEKSLIQGKTVLDCGTGSGILAICACLMGAKEVLGVDVNETAINEAEINRDLNNLSINHIKLMLSSALTINPKGFDVILMNVTPSIREMLLKEYQQKLKTGSLIIISGQKGTQDNHIQICQAYPAFKHIKTIKVTHWNTYIFRH